MFVFIEHFTPTGLYFVATTISPLRGYEPSGLTVDSGATKTCEVLKTSQVCVNSLSIFGHE